MYVETHQPHPMLALRLLKLRLFRATNLVMAFAMASFLGLTFVLPLYLQGLRGLDPFAQRPDDVPAGDRHPHLVADRRAHLPVDRARAG